MIGSIRSITVNHKIKQNKETGQLIVGEKEMKELTIAIPTGDRANNSNCQLNNRPVVHKYN
jgi:hypothetical protein